MLAAKGRRVLNAWQFFASKLLSTAQRWAKWYEETAWNHKEISKTLQPISCTAEALNRRWAASRTKRAKPSRQSGRNVSNRIILINAAAAFKTTLQIQICACVCVCVYECIYIFYKYGARCWVKVCNDINADHHSLLLFKWIWQALWALLPGNAAISLSGTVACFRILPWRAEALS